jgi:hypothetical protein
MEEVNKTVMKLPFRVSIGEESIPGVINSELIAERKKSSKPFQILCIHCGADVEQCLLKEENIHSSMYQFT